VFAESSESILIDLLKKLRLYPVPIFWFCAFS
jgi:hypothetical protein